MSPLLIAIIVAKIPISQSAVLLGVINKCNRTFSFNIENSSIKSIETPEAKTSETSETLEILK